MEKYAYMHMIYILKLRVRLANIVFILLTNLSMLFDLNIDPIEHDLARSSEVQNLVIADPLRTVRDQVRGFTGFVLIFISKN